ncbi:hypothetical protein [Nocardia sp. NBC_00511]|uniref:hypothetical protein n=1 Tax=Nocardia sp. NBC_00511 TaxID=2903591 RepID=UPI0030E35702
MTPRIRKFVVAAVAAGALITAPMPYALADCHSGGGRDGRGSLGDGGHGVFLPNGVGQLGCIPGSAARPCQGH